MRVWHAMVLTVTAAVNPATAQEEKNNETLFARTCSANSFGG
jgi:hypothetical protein